MEEGGFQLLRGWRWRSHLLVRVIWLLCFHQFLSSRITPRASSNDDTDFCMVTAVHTSAGVDQWCGILWQAFREDLRRSFFFFLKYPEYALSHTVTVTHYSSAAWISCWGPPHGSDWSSRVGWKDELLEPWHDGHRDSFVESEIAFPTCQKCCLSLNRFLVDYPWCAHNYIVHAHPFIFTVPHHKSCDNGQSCYWSTAVLTESHVYMPKGLKWSA